MIAAAPDPRRVRLASHGDESELLELCRRRHAEEGIGTFSAAKVRDVFRRAFDPGRDDRAVVGVVGAGRVEGSVGLIAETPWDSETVLLVTLWNYVLPECRASTHLRDLTAWAEQLAHPAPLGRGLPVSISALSTRKTEAQQRFYRRRMGEPVTVTWLCEILERAD